MDVSSFANFSRDELIARARSLGVDRAELMTRVELADEIVRRTEHDPVERQRARGWLGAARDLVASVVESGFSLPDAAAMIRGAKLNLDLKTPEPVATVTLAEIYAAQGHMERALGMLEEVLVLEPEHEAARRSLKRLQQEAGLSATSAPGFPPAQSGDGSRLDPTSESSEWDSESLSLEADAPLEPESSGSAADGPVQLAAEREPQEPSQDPTPLPGPTLVILRSNHIEPLVCWELGACSEESALQIVCVALSRGAGAVERSELVFSVTEPRGSAVLESLASDAVIRAAIGSGDGSEFCPSVVASELWANSGELEVTYRPSRIDWAPPSDAERALVREFIP